MKTFLATILFIFTAHANIPTLNKKVVTFVGTVIGTQVDRGECWDLAAAALDYAGAYLDRTNAKNIYTFGREVNYKKDVVFPGDIIQFENVTLQHETDKAIYTENMPHHTAIVYEVLGDGRYKIAHQNTDFSGRKVGLSELDVNEVKKGKLIFYRPVASK